MEIINLEQCSKTLDEAEKVLMSKDLTYSVAFSTYVSKIKPIFNFLYFEDKLNWEDSKKLSERYTYVEDTYRIVFSKLTPNTREFKYKVEKWFINDLYKRLSSKNNDKISSVKEEADFWLPIEYNYLISEREKYGEDNLFKSLKNEYNKLCKLYYTDLKGRKYYQVILDKQTVLEDGGYDGVFNKDILVDHVSISYNTSEDYAEYREYKKKEEAYDKLSFFKKLTTPLPVRKTLARRTHTTGIYAVKDQRGLVDAITNKKVKYYECFEPDEKDVIWYKKITQVDEYKVARDIGLILDLGLEKDYSNAVINAQTKYVQSYLINYAKNRDKRKAEQIEVEKALVRTKKAREKLNKDGL